MQDEASKVLETFNQYGEVFSMLKPRALLPFYHYPSMLISYDKSVVIKNVLEAWLVFTKLIADLKKQNFARSEIHEENTKVKFLSDNLATIPGTATRYRKDGTILESFDFTYTMRKVSDSWKIIVGIIHALGSNS
jgi:hypothetical protein